MEIQLQELIEQIKKNGVDTAERQATALLEQARAEADAIRAQAQADADALRAQAKEDADRLVRTGEDALRQASRNLLLAFRQSVTKELEGVIAQEVASVYSGDDAVALIAKMIETWVQKSETDDLTVLLGQEEAQALQAALLEKYAARFTQGVTLQIGNDFDRGLRVVLQNGRIYYDYSAQAVTDLLSAYLSPRITALMKEAEGV